MASFADSASRENYINCAQTWFTQMQGTRGNITSLLEPIPMLTVAGERLAETRFGGLPLYDDESPYDPVPVTIAMLADELLPHIPEVRELISQVRNYEHFGPPHVGVSRESGHSFSDQVQGDNGLYRQCLPVRDMHPVLPSELPSDDTWITWVQEAMPEAHYTIGVKDHGRYAPYTISDWVLREPFRNEQCNVEYGGPGGVRVGLFVILRMLMQAVRMGKMKSRPDNQLGEDGIAQYAKGCIKTLSGLLTDSQSVLARSRDTRRRSLNKQLEFQTMITPDKSRKAAAIDPPFGDGSPGDEEPVILSPPPVPKTQRKPAKSTNTSAGVSCPVLACLPLYLIPLTHLVGQTGKFQRSSLRR